VESGFLRPTSGDHFTIKTYPGTSCGCSRHRGTALITKVAMGFDSKTAASLARHKQFSTTADTYAHLSDRHKLKVGRAMGGLVLPLKRTTASRLDPRAAAGDPPLFCRPVLCYRPE
jgi:hypothetical protein